MAEYIERTEELMLAMNAGARAIENTKRYHGAVYTKDVYSESPQEIPYLQAAKVLREVSDAPAADVAPVSDDTSKAERIRALLKADKVGRLVVLPCKVADRLYEVTGRKTISVYKVRAIRVELFGLFIDWDIVEGFVWQSLSGINAGEIGKTVFLTRKEAEKALEVMKDA